MDEKPVRGPAILDSVMKTQAQADAANQKAMPAYEQAKAKADASFVAAQAAEAAAVGAAFQDQSLNDDAVAKIATWRADHKAAGDAKKKTENKPYNYIPSLIVLLFFIAAFFG